MRSKNPQKEKRFVGAIVLLAAVLILGSEIYWRESCVPVLPFLPVEGSQGYRLWYGATLRSFEHENKVICIPQGWEALGAVESNGNRARFEEDKTGVLLKKKAFDTKLLDLPNSSYQVQLVFPIETPHDYLSAYERITRRAFKDIGRLYGDFSTTTKTTHTVLVTAGLAGNTRSEGTRVYPDPSANRTFIVRTPEQPRSEELLIHAVAHLYNRFSGKEDGYLELQMPFSHEDFQELEASWSELAYASPGARHARTEYLYAIHAALQAKDFSSITEPPFSDPAALSQIRQTAIVAPGSSYLDYQYGHYVLLPLAMLALEGMLVEVSAEATVESLLQEAREKKVPLVTLIETALSPYEAKKFMSWIQGEETIPQHFINAGKQRYDEGVLRK